VGSSSNPIALGRITSDPTGLGWKGEPFHPIYNQKNTLRRTVLDEKWIHGFLNVAAKFADWASIFILAFVLSMIVVVILGTYFYQYSLV
jgi:hypothetical protein